MENDRFATTGHRDNDAYTAYLLGTHRPTQLTRTQVESLHAAASGAAESTERIDVGDNGIIARQVKMRELDCVLLTLKKIE